jgi:DNA-directed RNA polymerase specialized sigma24 family protein
MKVRWFGKTVSERCEYARKEEFVGVFECERAGLQRLALLLTANSEAAKRCLSRAFRECIASTSVSKEWVVSWTRRMVIRNAISLVMGPGGRSFVNTNDDADDGFVAFSSDDSLGAIAASESILGLTEFERFVFVICVLERYSIHDCALLLGKSPRDINEARQRVGNQVGQIDGLSNISQRFAMR